MGVTFVFALTIILSNLYLGFFIKIQTNVITSSQVIKNTQKTVQCTALN